uniref:Major facilitator superfamily (MFS) profile domain-containing protein n=1 Tax=Timema douglasi TaxID=61478 RepID=A0A7R8VAX6_TIMDO|nr:unnamed protein product [Timema douglasi]
MLILLQSVPSPLGGDAKPLSTDSSSWLCSLMCVGGLLATPVYSYLANRHSRKLTGYLVGLPDVIGWLMIATARSKTTLFTGRLFLGERGMGKDLRSLPSGFGSAGSTILCPLYVLEIVEDDTRGSLGTFLVLFTNGGILFAYVLGTYLSYTTFSTICLAAPIVFMAAFYWMPESPVYLFNQKNPAEARKALMWLWGGDLIAVEQEMMKLAEATDAVKENHSTKSSFIKNLTSKATLRGLLIGVGLMVNNQLSGIFAVLSYTVNIFQTTWFGIIVKSDVLSRATAERRELTVIIPSTLREGSWFDTVPLDTARACCPTGPSSTDPSLISSSTGPQIRISYTSYWFCFQDAGSDISPNLCTIIIGVLQLFGVYLTSTLVDRAGRKILLIVSNVASAISLAALGGFFFLKGHGYNVAHLGWLPITNLSIYVVGIALGVSSNPFIVINEIFTPEIRGFAVTVCICLLNALAFLITRFFTDLNTIIGVDGCYWFFAFCCLSSTFFCYFVVPETKKKSLYMIQKELAGEEITFKRADERFRTHV